MPDLTVEYFYVCESVRNFSYRVHSNTKANKSYIVRHEQLTPIEQEVQQSTLGWTCTCSGFQYRHKCSHVEFVKDHAKQFGYCGWHQLVDGGEVVNKGCPNCGGHIYVERHAV